ncbi:MAG: Preprotein translocase, SecE subunit [Parcubacteria group bacterium GW2011_GWC1_43_11b]|uniref:Protein translocase subunit SecE n=2 Tax=Candidatus Vogeliibacteriota TaxID=1817922 RepID=A0A1G2QBS6_9BACT|nr:MAG: Preprotein translocase, SecE subunit [Parcubacteria group bacterium GW2011_GWC1_43_11b]KKT09175.1 MAG: Preprotein translocase, SecE subunit [Parcubacteria group bacterium GW2011_GWA1_43_21]OHA58024.1 MAG: preprotein translocase subunit SecE [Candidatus Vogelbacteria bacterium RIFOXYB1_FULL_42_16]OHA58387.1 MAG: preprotein translocase subunit SecE [Candidatus Vogelbacteria bacterium RIFOXYD1_FULL_42_15]
MSFIDYLKDTRGEMKHVSWPTRDQVLNYTLLVLVLSLGVGVLLGAFDLLFTTGLKDIIFK